MWVHAAIIMALPVLWQPTRHQHHQQQLSPPLAPPAAAAAGKGADRGGGIASAEKQDNGHLLQQQHQQQQLCEIASSATATVFFRNSGLLFSSGQLQRYVGAVALRLLAVATMPFDGQYGGTQRYCPAVVPYLLSGEWKHVLIHELVAAILPPVYVHKTAGEDTVAEAIPVPPMVTGVTQNVSNEIESWAWVILRNIAAQTKLSPVAALHPAGGAAQTAAAAGGGGGGGGGCSGNGSPASSSSSSKHVAVEPRVVQRVLRAYEEYWDMREVSTVVLLGRLRVLLGFMASLDLGQLQRGQQGAKTQPAAGAGVVTGDEGPPGGLLDCFSMQQLHQLASTFGSSSSIGSRLSGLGSSDTSSSSSSAHMSEYVSRQPVSWLVLAASYSCLSVAAAVAGSACNIASTSSSSSRSSSSTCSSDSSRRDAEVEVVKGMAAAVALAGQLLVLVGVALLQNLGYSDSSAGSSSSSNNAALPSAAAAVSTAAAAAPGMQASRLNEAQPSQGVKRPVLVGLRCERLLECTLAALQTLWVLSRQLQLLVPSAAAATNGCCGATGVSRSNSSSSMMEAALEQASGALSYLKPTLHPVLEGIMEACQIAAPSSSSVEVPTRLNCFRSDGGSSSSGSSCCGSAISSSSSSNSRVPRQGSPVVAVASVLLGEVGCWAAAVLSSCYGQLGCGSSMGGCLAAALHSHEVLEDVELVIPSHKEQQQQQQPGQQGQQQKQPKQQHREPEQQQKQSEEQQQQQQQSGWALRAPVSVAVVPVHAAVIAAGCEVLGSKIKALKPFAPRAHGWQHHVTGGEQQQQQNGSLGNKLGLEPGAATSGGGAPHASGCHGDCGRAVLRLSPAVNPTALSAVVEYLYTGRATLLGPCGADTSSTSSRGAGGCQGQEQQQQQQRQQLRLLGKKLDLPGLAALAAAAPPAPGMYLSPSPPVLHKLLPQQVLVKQLHVLQGGELGQVQQQQQGKEEQRRQEQQQLLGQLLPEQQQQAGEGGYGTEAKVPLAIEHCTPQQEQQHCQGQQWQQQQGQKLQPEQVQDEQLDLLQQQQQQEVWFVDPEGCLHTVDELNTHSGFGSAGSAAAVDGSGTSTAASEPPSAVPTSSHLRCADILEVVAAASEVIPKAISLVDPETRAAAFLGWWGSREKEGGQVSGPEHHQEQQQQQWESQLVDVPPFVDVCLAAPVVQQCNAPASTGGSSSKHPAHARNSRSRRSNSSSSSRSRSVSEGEGNGTVCGTRRHGDGDWQEALCSTSSSSGRTVCAGFLPCHSVVLASRCPYFEALCSRRWQGGASFSASSWDHGLSSSSSSSNNCRGSSSSSSSPCACAAGEHHNHRHQEQQQQQRQLRVLTVPEADAEVAAVLLHWLYTDELPKISAFCACDLAPSIFHPQHRHQQQQEQQHEEEQGKRFRRDGRKPTSKARPEGDLEEDMPQEQLCCSCCVECHAVRVLLRLWRCCELLLLPQLQQQCLGEVQLQLQQLPGSCCVLLLQDCYNLGAAEAAEGVWQRLLAMYGEQGTSTNWEMGLG